MMSKYAIAAMIAALAVNLVAQLADPGNGGGSYMAVAAVIGFMVIPMSASRYVNVRWGLTGTSQKHDEFELQILARAGARAHIAVLLLLTAIFGWLIFATQTGLRVPQSASDWATVGLSVLGIGFAFPILLAERMSPTIPGEQDQEIQ